MLTVRDRFLDYAKKLGLDLLRDDIRFIDRSLTRIPKDRHRQVLYQYAQTWENELSKNAGSIQAQSLGRRAANALMLEKRNT